MWKFSLVLLLMVGCMDDCDGPTSPDGGQQPPIVEEPVEPVEPPVVFNPGPEFDIRRDGFSAFALCGRDERTQRAVWRSARNRGYHYGRVLSESFGWNNNSVFFRVAGKAIKYKRNNNGQLIVKEDGALGEFRRCLEIAANEDMGVLVMGLVTSLRDATHGGNDEKREAWIRAIAKAGEPFDNVGWQVANEAWHQGSHINRVSFLNSMYRILKKGGDWVSQDQNLGAKFDNTARYRYDYRWKSDGADFHPWRNDDPSRSDIRDILRENGGFALLSETTSWTANASDLDTFGWLVTTDKAQIQTYMNNCRPNEGCAWVFHSIEGLFTEGAFSWMPQRGRSSQSLPLGIQGVGRTQVSLN